LIDSDDVVDRDLSLYLCFDRNVTAFFRHLFTGSNTTTYSAYQKNAAKRSKHVSRVRSGGIPVASRPRMPGFFDDLFVGVFVTC